MAEINTKLIIVEGPPCSGKSETARYASGMAESSGHRASFFDENDMNHPADYAFHAFMTENQVRSLTLEERRQLYAESVKILDGYVVPLTKISVSLFGKVVPYKIYDRLDWALERPVMLEHWRSFAEKARVESMVYVFNSCFLQSPLGETMMRLDFGTDQTKAYIEEIYNLVAPLNPIIIYLRCTNVRARVEEVSERRTAVWLDSAITYHTAQGYGRRNGLTGFDGYIACLEERQKRELEILDRLPVKKLVITDPFKDWGGAHKTIEAFFAGKTLQKA